MNPEAAQVIALAAHGTAWLRSPLGNPPPELDVKNSAFAEVKHVTFEIRGQDRPFAGGNVREWLQELRDRGVQRILLTRLSPGDARNDDQRRRSPHVAAAFVGGTQWALVTAPVPQETWRPQWRNRRSVLEGTYWSEVVFVTVQRSDVLNANATKIAEAMRNLTSVLSRAALFARHHNLGPWADQFELALKQGTQDQPDLRPFPDALPSTHPQSARQLLGMAMGAWVFGGMGSWNDVDMPRTKDQRTYEALTSDLYAAVIDACIAAANAEPER